MNNTAQPQPIPPDNQAVIAHINLLQGIISRLANNSASCKTWCLSIVAALLSLAGAVHDGDLVTIALVPVAVFGFIDTMYLAFETAYRELYKGIVTKLRESRYTLADVYEANAWFGIRYFVSCFVRAFLSWAIWPVYLGLVAAYLAAWHYGALEALTKVPK
ncbi:MAG TPA: hypothetical protein VKR55_26105 [Bradyrhizobium sp.]|uniref:hypothetical protein n=1 Tax=Bradyrhizobium sp. TaxID=376 RepID=UPI002CD4D14E|nr:hypothetical protein [Bradyrhizobium sp.]HLZ05611.1 hypothetical protein [Bradyrhizobium sp.]